MLLQGRSLRRRCAFLAAAPLAVLLFCGCSDDDAPHGHTTEATSSGTASAGGGGAGGQGGGLDLGVVQEHVATTLQDLAGLGRKIAGTEAGAKAGEYLKERLEAAGLAPVTFEPFSFSAFQLGSSSMTVTLGGQDVPMDYEVFQYSGSGYVDADIVYLGGGTAEDYADKDVTGKIVLVERDPAFHRQAQYQQVYAHGGAAMLYISASPENLIQIGTVSDAEEGLAQIPTLTVGAEDGAAIKAALEAGEPASAAIDVEATLAPAIGRNVVGRLPGTDPSGAYVLVGAHYDTWYAGATDNGTGVAALLETARLLAAGPSRRLGVVFVGYDGEELGLLGGYDFLRKHIVAGQEPTLAFINLEMPAAGEQDSRALAHTNDGPVDPALKEARLHDLYPLYVGMEIVPSLSGGLIPTDIQGMYWHGLQGMTTYCATPYYHTPEDTPDKVDTAFLASSVAGLVDVLDELDALPVASFDQLDHEVWNPGVTAAPQPSGDLLVQVTVLDAAGDPRPGAAVRVWLDVDDFTRVFAESAVADEAGKVSVTVPQSALAEGNGSRWIHVTAGDVYPRSERIIPVSP